MQRLTRVRSWMAYREIGIFDNGAPNRLTSSFVGGSGGALNAQGGALVNFFGCVQRVTLLAGSTSCLQNETYDKLHRLKVVMYGLSAS
jgi:hypothetical protein